MQCNQCFGTGMVQTGSFGPKPCPHCYGKGTIEDESSVNSPNHKYTLMDNIRNLSLGQIILISIFAGFISMAFWPQFKGGPGVGVFILLFMLRDN